MNLVTSSLVDGVQLIEIDNPPVNATSQQVRQELFDCFKAAIDDQQVKAIVLCCAGSTWVAGADIKEFGKPPAEPLLIDVIERIEHSPKPVVAALKGSALGGGLELALGCHYRVAAKSSKLGLPESSLGIVPGAGGIPRLLRLAGAEVCAEMITTAKAVDASKALSLGLVDAIIDGDLTAAAKDMAASKAALSGEAIRRTRDLPVSAAAPGFYEKTQAKLEVSHRGLNAPMRCLALLKEAESSDFLTAVGKSRDAFRELVKSDQAKALRQAFMAERVATKPAGLPKVDKGFSKVGIVGAGTMGTGIAIAVLNAGLPVVLLEQRQEALDKARASIQKTMTNDVAKGRIGQSDADRRMDGLHTSTDYAALHGCDLVIEAVFEDMAVKREVFAQIERSVALDTVVASNTSFLDINVLAQGCERPQNVVGMHFFSPANLMKLLENVRASGSDPMALARIQDFGRRIGKVPVLIGVSDGFVGNRMLAKRMRECYFMAEEGALPQDIDEALFQFGFPIGQFQLNDLAGIDVAWRNRQSRIARLSERERQCDLLDQIHALGRLGQKTGAGFYLYNEKRERTVDPVVTELVLEHSRKRGITRRQIPHQEIIERALFSMINEGAKILEEGIASRPEEIDTIWLNGYGFPRHRGGPMFYADSVGLPTVVEAMQKYARSVGEEYWTPAPLLRKLAAEGGTFYAMAQS